MTLRRDATEGLGRGAPMEHQYLTSRCISRLPVRLSSSARDSKKWCTLEVVINAQPRHIIK